MCGCGWSELELSRLASSAKDTHVIIARDAFGLDDSSSTITVYKLFYIQYLILRRSQNLR